MTLDTHTPVGSGFVTLPPGRQRFRRWLVFNGVGLIGALVQLSVLILLAQLGLGYRAATILAVEAAVLNNFMLHRRWTWPDARLASGRETMRRLAAFNLTVGAVSIAENVGLMEILVGRLGLDLAVANAVAIGACSTANFLVSDLFVFNRGCQDGIVEPGRVA